MAEILGGDGIGQQNEDQCINKIGFLAKLGLGLNQLWG